MKALDLSRPMRIHIIGIGGAGMSAIATVLRAMGHTVSGSDLRDSVLLDRLRALGVEVFVGHSEDHLTRAEAVAISSAINPNNVELDAAHRYQLPVYRRAEVLAAITKLRRTAAIAGTHGKTSTSSMLALVLTEAQLQPSYLIGGEINEIGTNATWGSGDWLVVEADESDGTFLELDTELAVVTSIEADHLEHYGSFGLLRDAFTSYLNVGGRKTVVCIDDEIAQSLAPDDTLTYGFDERARLRLSNLSGGRSNIVFDVALDGAALGSVELPLPGEHNARNAAGAIGAALLIGAPFESARRALARFAGVARRFEFRGERSGVSFVDDYAHLPGEVRAALAAARHGGWSRLICVFQPHRFSRTASVGEQFAHAFDDADLVVVTDIYAAGESPRPGVSAENIVATCRRANPTQTIEYLGRRDEVIEYLRAELRPGDCCLTLGAGDLTSLPDEMLALSSW